MSTTPRPFLDDRHLWSVAGSDAGSIALKPNHADAIYFDVAWSNSYPTNGPDGDHGSTVLDIGHGVTIRGTGHLIRGEDGWSVTRLTAKQYPTGRELTRQQHDRACELIATMILGWISTHAGDMAQADDIYRNNAARTLEEAIVRHEGALKVLRRNLRACENGRSYDQYPDLPTKR